MKHLGLSSRVPGVPKLPPGLAEIMETLSREVIVHNPPEEEMYRFCAAHLKKLLELRDEPVSVSSPQKKSLEERIAIAQQKVRERAEKHWKKYDTKHKPIINIEPTQSLEVDEPKIESSTPHTLFHALGVPGLVRDEEFRKEKKTSIIFPIDTAALIAPVLSIQTQLREAIDDNLEVKSKESQEESASKNIFADQIENCNVEQMAISGNSNITESTLVGKTLCVNENEHIESESANDIASFIIDQIIKNVEDTQNVGDAQIEAIDIQNGTNLSSQIQFLNQDEKEKNIERNYESVHSTDEKSSETQPTENNNSNDDKAPDNVEPSLKTNYVLLEPESLEVDSAIPKHKPEKLVNGEKKFSIEQETNENEVLKAAKEDIKDCDHSNTCETDKNATSDKENESKENSIDIRETFIGVKEEHVNDVENIKPEDCTDDAKSSDGTDTFGETTATNETDDNDFTNESIVHNNEAETIDTVTDTEESTIKIDSSNLSSPNFNLSQAVDSEPELSHSKSKTMNLETAAVTIQKVFRSYMFKSRASTLEDGSNQEVSIDDSYINDVLVDADAKHNEGVNNEYYESNKERRPLGLTRMDTTLQTVNEEKSLSLSTDDSSTLSSAATTIQAHVRGFLVRNRLYSNKTVSSNSGMNSDEPSSLEADNEQNKQNKTVLNIHIVPEGGGFLSRDESTALSLDLPYDISPSASVNLHPLGYDKNEKRKQLKRENAIQIISPPTINSGKLSEDVESLKEVSVIETYDSVGVTNHISSASTIHSKELINGHESVLRKENTVETAIQMYDSDERLDNSEHTNKIIETNSKNISLKNNESSSEDNQQKIKENGTEIIISQSSSDNDVSAVNDKINRGGLLHSSEFHDMLIPTAISRSDMGATRGE